jgi:hypothetical protein
MTMRLPFARSAALSFCGGIGHESPNAVDSVRVASGRVSPGLIMGRTIAEPRPDFAAIVRRPPTRRPRTSLGEGIGEAGDR